MSTARSRTPPERPRGWRPRSARGPGRCRRRTSRRTSGESSATVAASGAQSWVGRTCRPSSTYVRLSGMRTLRPSLTTSRYSTGAHTVTPFCLSHGHRFSRSSTVMPSPSSASGPSWATTTWRPFFVRNSASSQPCSVPPVTTTLLPTGIQAPDNRFTCSGVRTLSACLSMPCSLSVGTTLPPATGTPNGVCVAPVAMTSTSGLSRSTSSGVTFCLRRTATCSFSSWVLR